MEQPNAGTIRMRDKYWVMAKRERARTGKLPGWVFDFISIHKLSNGQFGLCSPMCLVVGETRPKWENEEIKTLHEAVSRARELGRMNNVFVVNCI